VSSTPPTPPSPQPETVSTSDQQDTTAGQQSTFVIPDQSSAPLSSASFLDGAAALSVIGDTTTLTTTVTDSTSLVNLVGSTDTLTTILGDTAASQAFTDALIANPSSFSTIASVPSAAQQILSDPHMQAALAADPVLRNSVITALQSVQHVHAVDLTTSTGGTGVQVTVKEFLPTDAAQTALPSTEGTSLASISLEVATSEGTTSFHPLKVLQIEAPGVAQGGVSSATVHFSVTEAELLASGLNIGSVALLHLDNGVWTQLPTTIVSGPVNGVYELSAVTPHFSYFAIAAAQPAQSTSSSFAGLGIALLILAVLAVIAIAVVVMMKKKQA
jgi:hypothetical protein